MFISELRKLMKGNFNKDTQDEVIKFIKNKNRKIVNMKFVDSFTTPNRAIESICSKRVFKVTDKTGYIVEEKIDERVTIFNSKISVGLFKDVRVENNDNLTEQDIKRPIFTKDRDNFVVVKDVMSSDRNVFGRQTVEVYIVV